MLMVILFKRWGENMLGDKEVVKVCEEESHKMYIGLQKFDISIRKIVTTGYGVDYVYWVELPLDNRVEEIAHKSRLVNTGSEFYFLANGIKVKL